MKKIGILTFHCANNYGAVLQGYALQKYLSSLGHNVKIIDYRPEYLLKPYIAEYNKFFLHSGSRYLFLRFVMWCVKWCVNTLRYGYKRHKYAKLFKDFSAEYINLSNDSICRSGACNLNYDVYVMGSDQIWNPCITVGIDNIFFGNFKTKSGAKCITYAASSSYYNFDEVQKNDISLLLKNFDNISTREVELQDYLKCNFNVESQLVCDPTLLVNRYVWDNIAVEPKNKGYVLVYFTSPSTLKLANIIAKEKGLVVVPIYNIYSSSSNVGKVCSLNEYVGLFKYADYVISSSFHGVAFSIIFNREFCVLGSGSSSDSRVLSILKRVRINGRYITNVNDLRMSMFDSKIDYTIVNSKIEEFRTLSKEYLQQSL